MTLQVTELCNFRCKYCVYTNNDGSDRKHSNKVMTEETMKKAVDFLHIHSVDSESVAVGFYGGEPLLNFNVIKNAIEYTENIFKGKKVEFAITTNASLLSNDILQYFDNHNVGITISIDGPQKINDANRVYANQSGSVFDTVKTKIEQIVKNHKNISNMLSVNMVIDPKWDYNDYLRVFDEILHAQKS